MFALIFKILISWERESVASEKLGRFSFFVVRSLLNFIWCMILELKEFEWWRYRPTLTKDQLIDCLIVLDPKNLSGKCFWRKNHSPKFNALFNLSKIFSNRRDVLQWRCGGNTVLSNYNSFGSLLMELKICSETCGKWL